MLKEPTPEARGLVDGLIKWFVEMGIRRVHQGAKHILRKKEEEGWNRPIMRKIWLQAHESLDDVYGEGKGLSLLRQFINCVCIIGDDDDPYYFALKRFLYKLNKSGILNEIRPDPVADLSEEKQKQYYGEPKHLDPKEREEKLKYIKKYVGLP